MMAHPAIPAAEQRHFAPRLNVTSPVDASDASRWAVLFRIAGFGALLTAVLIPLQVVAFIVWPLPEGGVTAWFETFQDSALIGLISFDLVLLIEEVLLVPIILALYVLLRARSASLALIATATWLLSVALFIGSNTAFDMLALSNHYASAASDAERAIYVAAGQGALTSYMEYGTAFTMAYVLGSLSGVLIGVAMLRSPVFSRVAGWAVVIANLLGFGLFIPTVGVFLSLVSVVILVVWYALVGWWLVRLPGDLAEASNA
jgi:hypothetical protein